MSHPDPLRQQTADHGFASWIVREIATGRVLFETFSQTWIEGLNTDRYEAVPIGQYLGELNARIKAEAER